MEQSLFDEFPPALVRLLARRRVGGKRVRAVGDDEIAIASGIHLSRVREIYSRSAWDDVTVGEMRAFCAACGFDPESGADRNRVRAYQNQEGGPKFTYLRTSPWWKTVFLPLIQTMREEDARET